MTEGGIDITPTKDQGVLKIIKKEGDPNGEFPWKGDKVTVHYVGTLEDGTKFDSSRDRGDKFTFNLGKGEVIKGWDVGVATMKKGEVAQFTIKSEYGYGETGSPPKIPGGATLIFEVELFDFEGEDITKNQDLGVIRRIKVNGEGFDTPNDGGTVEVHLTGRFLGRTFIDKDLSFTLGEGQDMGIPRGVEMAIEKMKKKESCRIIVKPQYGFGEEGLPTEKIPANAVLEYDIVLATFERAKESWQLDGEQKLEQAKLFKERGTKFFKEGKYEMAANKYSKIIDFLEHEISLKDGAEDDRRTLLQAGRLNLAMCHLKTKAFLEARNVCDKVIEENPSSEKAYFRRGDAYLAMNDHELAKADFNHVLVLDPENKAAQNKIVLCQRLMKNQRDKEKKTFANMFDRFAEIDAKRLAKERRKEKPMEVGEWNGAPEGSKNADVMEVKGDIPMNIDLNKAMEEDENVQKI